MPHPYSVLTAALDSEFPDWNRTLGGHNCRPIRGSTRWSDHAYLTPRPHALDIGVPDLSAPYADRLAWGDDVYRWLYTIGLDRLAIRYIRWREDAAHRGHHLHVSFLPNQRNKQPACDGGPADLPAPNIAPLTDQEDDMLKRGDRGDDVRRYQDSLTALGYDLGTVDGIWGAKTSAANAAFQGWVGFDVTPDQAAGYVVAEARTRDLLRNVPAGPRGPKGDQGDPGPPGKDADPQHRHSLDLGDATGGVV